MILSDINLLLYAHNKAAKEHEQAKNWLEKTLNEDTLCLSWHTIMGFVRISTSARIFPNPFTSPEAISNIRKLVEHSNSVTIVPGRSHFSIFERLVAESKISGAMLMDAHLAALAIEHGATLASNDRDFRLFDGLNLLDPIGRIN